MYKIEDIINKINLLPEINNEMSFQFAKISSKLLRSDYEKQSGRRIIINILNNWNKIESSSQELWSDIIEAAGFYPYLHKEESKIVLKSTAGNIRKEFHKSEKLDIYMHEEQYILNKILKEGKNLIVSAPTSFGKSLLIEEIVASFKYKNIIIIQPTLALLDETRKKLMKYKEQYKIIVRTSQAPSIERGNLFLLTGERVMEYKDLPNIEFLVVDEFYKLSSRRDDERSDVLNSATNLLLNKHGSKFYMLGPNIERISDGFAKKYNAEFYRTDYSLVDNQSIDIYSQHLNMFGAVGKKKIYKENTLFTLLLELSNEQTIIYCSSPKRARYLSKKFVDFLKSNEKVIRNDNLNIINWIKKNVSDKWVLIDCLNYSIGFHDGALQKHITTTIINYFNNDRINYLFCTSTIIEGVNTSAKNIIFFDETKGLRTKIDFFDYSNIKGRSGRMMVHYVGKIYNFNTPPKSEEIIIDIPFYEQNPLSDEVLIQLNHDDVINKETDQYRYIYDTLTDDERVLFKRNGDLVKGQKTILDILNKDIHSNYELINWTAYPSYRQLTYVLNLAWNSLLKPGESVRPMSLNKLVKVTHDYAHTQNISALVNSNFIYLRQSDNSSSDEDLFDEAIRDAFQILKHWFQYKVPKWLNVVNQIQLYLCEKKNLKPGNFSFYASQIENDFIRENLSILYEYGIPKSAIDKIGKLIPENLSEDEVITLIGTKRYYNTVGLLEYEKEKILEIL